MPRVPGLPDIQPVDKPFMSPREAGRPGNAVAQLAETGEDISLQGLQIEAQMRKAQEHVDSLAARNELDAAYADMQAQLAKTQNSRDIPDVLQQGQSNLNDIARRWSSSPAGIQIQLDADSLRPSMQHVSQIRQIDLMGKEFKINLDHQGQVLAQSYATARAAGDTNAEQQALNGYTQAVQGGVNTGLIGDAEAQETVRNFRIAGQTLEVKQALESLDPATNAKMVNRLQEHPEDFPDLTKEQITDLAEKGNSAFESHTRQKEWADQQLVKMTIVPQIIKDNTDPQTGVFHLDWALKKASELPPSQGEVAGEELRSHAAMANADLMGNLNKADDDIESAISKSNFSGARQIADKYRLSAETAGLPWFDTVSKRIDAARRQSDAEFRAEAHYNQWDEHLQEQAQSNQTANSLIPQVAAGIVSQQQLNNLIGQGSGKINYSTYLQLSHLATQVEKEPDTRAALNVLYDSLPVPPKTASPGELAQYDMLKWNLYQQWQQQVSEKQLKGDDKTKAAIEIVKPFVSRDIADRLDQALKGPQPTKTQMVKGIVGSFFNYAPWEFPVPDSNAPRGTIPSRPKGVPSDAVWNPNANAGKGAWQK